MQKTFGLTSFASTAPTRSTHPALLHLPGLQEHIKTKIETLARAGGVEGVPKQHKVPGSIPRMASKEKISIYRTILVGWSHTMQTKLAHDSQSSGLC